jgi:hypothetical protein
VRRRLFCGPSRSIVDWSFTYNTSAVLYKTEHLLSFSATAGQYADGRFSVPRKDAFLLMAPFGHASPAA